MRFLGFCLFFVAFTVPFVVGVAVVVVAAAAAAAVFTCVSDIFVIVYSFL